MAPVAASHSTNCDSLSSNGYQTGETLLGIGSKISGVSATTQQLGIPEVCTDTTGLDLMSVTSYWVAIQPGQNLENRIIQVGAAKCGAEPNVGWYGSGNGDICDFDYAGEWRYFYAYGGCNANVPWPRDLGPMTGYTHEFKILVGTTIGFYVDGVRKASIPKSEMNCWSSGTDRGVVACEVHDVGDSCGGFAGYPVRFSSIKQRKADLSYATWQQVQDPCTNKALSTHRCDTYWSGSVGNRVDFWSVQ